jgi:hypothetical protein
MSNAINILIQKIEDKHLDLTINLERPIFVQPEDRILYRSARIILILGLLNIKTGLSKEVIACIDFLLRNPGYQKQFIIEYFKDNTNNLAKKLGAYNPSDTIEIDFNIVQYKSVPWDLRFNDMFLFLHLRDYVKFIGQKPNFRVVLIDKGIDLYKALQEIYIDEINFLELFGKRISEEKAVKIITDIIPNTYWRENEKFDY